MPNKVGTRITLKGAPFAAGSTFNHTGPDGTVSIGTLAIAGPTVSLVIWDNNPKRFNFVYSRDLAPGR